METLGARSEAQHFFLEVEDHFGRLRGRPLLLSPRDVGLVQQWHEAGVPLRVVLKALERFFEREQRRERPRRRAPTLEYCERDVYELWEEWKASQLGGESQEDGDSGGRGRGTQLDALCAHLAAMPARLAGAAQAAEGRGEARVARALRRAASKVEDMAELASGGDLNALERDLAALESRVIQAAERQLGEAGQSALRAEVERQVAPYRARLEERAAEVLLRKAEQRALLGRFGVPRIALFSF